MLVILVTDQLDFVDRSCIIKQSIVLLFYLSISSTRQEIANAAERKALLGGLFRVQETYEVNSIAQHQETCVNQL